MKFIDSVKIQVRSGHGGAGMSHFRREKFIPFGGPDGGDGGHGGDVIFRGDANKSTLLDLRYQQHQFAQDGEPGGGRNKQGKVGEHKVILVPLGTVVKDVESGSELMEILEPIDYVFLKGGLGGKGNTWYKSSTNRAPEQFQSGLPGQELWVQLELKLMADVGLVGFPNAGKSTLISAISKARPKVADYPFTTLVPNLGVVQTKDYEAFVVADIPGLIEGAHEGKGLGDRFLQHIERTALLVILLDASGFAEHPTWEEFQILLREMEMYSPLLIQKPRIIALNKMDIAEDQKKITSLKKKLEKSGEKVFKISGATHLGLSEFLEYLSETTLKYKQSQAAKKNQ